MSASDHFDFWICYRGPKNKKNVFFYFSPFSYLRVKTAFKVRVEISFLWNTSRTIRDRGIVSMDEFYVFECEIWLTYQIFKKSFCFHKNDFSTLTLNAVFTPQIWKRGKIKKHEYLIFRSSITYPKIKMIGGGHLKYSPCYTDFILRKILCSERFVTVLRSPHYRQRAQRRRLTEK